ncbi:hypothetical protein BQ8794_10449 [Mesorhizobium prunaredense]|uniref:Uncharacterized protein n=1 Tax=Mesorhizobium prunaredense TaxID=1631249 RepID=A0A1R3UZL7_9HYPH|nr:hypothetical protein BQ8794_10449 [Mesorhizobium prunaredense]
MMSQVVYCAWPHGSGDYAVGDAVEFAFHKRGTLLPIAGDRWALG